jgi:hypothetical protein
VALPRWDFANFAAQVRFENNSPAQIPERSLDEGVGP